MTWIKIFFTEHNSKIYWATALIAIALIIGTIFLKSSPNKDEALYIIAPNDVSVDEK